MTSTQPLQSKTMSPTRTVHLLFVCLMTACGPARLQPPSYEAEVVEPPLTTVATQPRRPAPPRVRAVSTQPFLYRIESGVRPSYLFGTLRLGVGFDEAMPAEHLSKIDEARIVFQELDPEAGNIEALAANASLPNHQRLEQFLTSVAWHRLASELLGEVDSVRLRTLRPWVPMVYLTRRRAETIRQERSADMDRELNDYVRQQGVEFQALETIEQQAAALGAVSDTEMGRVVRDMVLEPERLNRELHELIEAYLDADEARVGAALRQSVDPSLRSFNEALYEGRNKRWFETIEPLLEDGGLFIAVSLGHMLGDDGLIVLLRQAGHPVERIR